MKLHDDMSALDDNDRCSNCALELDFCLVKNLEAPYTLPCRVIDQSNISLFDRQLLALQGVGSRQQPLGVTLLEITQKLGPPEL